MWPGNRMNIRTKRVNYPNQTFDAALVADDDKQLLISSVAAVNGSAASNTVAVAHSMTLPQWEVYRYLDSGTATEITDAIQSNEETEIFTTTIGDGFIVRAENPFDLVSLQISQEGAGGEYSVLYWNGTTFTDAKLINALEFNETNKQGIAFEIPSDWVPGGVIADLPDSQLYTILVATTTAPAQEVLVTGMKVAQILALRREVLPEASLQVQFVSRQLLLQQGEEIIAFFAYPDEQNTMEMSYQINP